MTVAQSDGAPVSAGAGANSSAVQQGQSDEHAAAEVCSGYVKWFDATRGFGFIVPDNSESDVLLHFSVLRDHGRRMLPEGTRVSCEVSHGERGLQASKIVSFDLSTATGVDFDVRRPPRSDRVDPMAIDRKSTRLNSSHVSQSRMPSSA